MSQPLQVQVGFPVPTADQAALLICVQTVLELAEPLAAVRVPGRPGEPFLEDWQVTRAALMARMTGTLRGVANLSPSMSRLDGAALCRTLVDHVIHFVWISADPAGRLPRFLSKTYGSALNKHERWADRGEELLTPDLHRHYTAFVAAHQEGTGKLPRMASTVDDEWLAKIREAAPTPLQIPSMTELYQLVYDPFAELDHPSVSALQAYVHLDPHSSAAWVDGEPERDRDTDMRPYWLAVWAMVWALLVAALSQSRPARGDLHGGIRRIRALREYDRHGLLAVTEGPDGFSVGLVPDADEHIDAMTRADGQPH